METTESRADRAELEPIARAIWAVMREYEDRCDMELEDNGKDEPVWEIAQAAWQASRATLPQAGAQEDALGDLQYRAGLVAGWNFAVDSDQEGMQKAMASRAEAVGVLKELRAHQAAPSPASSQGWQWVPIEPTKEMALAGAKQCTRDADDDPYSARGQAIVTYMDMLDAAPKAPPPASVEGG